MGQDGLAAQWQGLPTICTEFNVKTDPLVYGSKMALDGKKRQKEKGRKKGSIS